MKTAIIMHSDACLELGKVYDLPLDNPKRMEAVKRCNSYWKEIEAILKRLYHED